MPTARLETDNTATPLALSVAEPSVAAPSLNVTLPVGPEAGLTVAVNVTSCPNAEGFRDEVNVMVVATTPPVTVCVSGDDVLLV